MLSDRLIGVLEMVGLMPHAKLQVVHDAGHLAWLDQIDECTNLITAFAQS